MTSRVNAGKPPVRVPRTVWYAVSTLVIGLLTVFVCCTANPSGALSIDVPKAVEKANNPGASAGDAAVCPPQTDRVGLNVIPWAEINRPEFVDKGVRGLTLWTAPCRTAIISTLPGRSGILRAICGRTHGLRILPGVKTVARLGLHRFDSTRGWKEIAGEIETFCEVAGAKTVLLENETALVSYWKDKSYDINLDELSGALAQLPKDVQYIWYPGCSVGNEEGQRRLAAVCRVAQDALKNVRFVDQSVCGPRSLGDKWSILAKRRLDSIAREPTIPIVYFYGLGSRYWQDEQLGEVLALVRDRWGPTADVIVYPGIKCWADAARLLGPEVPEATCHCGSQWCLR